MWGFAMRNVFRGLGLGVALLGLTVVGSNPAQAGLEMLNLAGSFSATSGFGSSGPFGASTPFTLTATFNPTSMNTLAPGIDATSTVALIQVTGFAAHTTVPGGLNILLVDKSSGIGGFGAGLIDSLSNLFVALFATTTPTLDAATPVPVVFGSNVGSFFTSQLQIPLSGGDGLFVDGFSGDLSATITAVAAVPEPASVGLLGLAIGVLAIGLRRRQRA
jgi:hypothetical protein